MKDIANWARGLCMGAADIVPGVSGGTMALILGHYERLLTAISHVDTHLAGLVLRRKFREAAEYLDFRFLIALGVGIATGIVGLASLMHWLLEHHLEYTYAVFTGLILASSFLVAKRLSVWKWPQVILLGVGILAAWQVCVLNPAQGNLTPLTAFLSASVAICAMILPGISGAFVLLLLGLYHPITELIKGLPRGEFTTAGLFNLACFGAGCAVGLLAFSRLLRWLLANRHDATLAFLVGLMLGSLYKIWPFQRATEVTKLLEFKEQRFELLWPGSTDVSIVFVLVLAAAAFAGTFAIEYIGSKAAEPEAAKSV